MTIGHELREPAQTYNMVPDIALDSLARTSKMCDAGYFSVFNREEVRIYDAETTKVVIFKPPVLKGWHDKISTLWQIPLVNQAPRPDSGHMTSPAPGTRATSWDVEKHHLHLAPPQQNYRQHLPAQDKNGGCAVFERCGRISYQGNLVCCGAGW